MSTKAAIPTQIASEESSLENDGVAKYTAAADICNEAMLSILEYIRVGIRSFEICDFGDQEIRSRLSRVYTKGSVKKGIAYPTSISVNNCICNFSPCNEDPSFIKDGDVVKIDLGCHIDGYVAVLAHTITIMKEIGSQTSPHNSISFAYHYANSVVREIVPKKCLSDVMRTVTSAFREMPYCLIDGSGIYEMKRFNIHGLKVLDLKQSTEAIDSINGKLEPFKAYVVDVIFSSGEGKTKNMESRNTTFERVHGSQSRLKLRASRKILTEIDNIFGFQAFHERYFDAENSMSRFALQDLLSHNMITVRPPLCDKPDSVVARFKWTILVHKFRTKQITMAPSDDFIDPRSSSEFSSPSVSPLATSQKIKKKAKDRSWNQHRVFSSSTKEDKEESDLMEL